MVRFVSLQLYNTNGVQLDMRMAAVVSSQCVRTCMQVEERGGFIWLFWGDKQLPEDERPPIPFTPELEDPSWKAVYGEIEFECGHWGEVLADTAVSLALTSTNGVCEASSS